MTQSDKAAARKRLKELSEDLQDPLQIEDRFLGMFYGPKGTGKTIIALGLCQALLKDSPRKKIIHVDTSRGYVSLRNHPKLAENVKSVPYKGYEYLETLIDAIKFDVPPFDNVGALVFDEMSTMVDRDIELVYRARDKSDAPEWPDYFKATQRVKELMTYHFNTNPDVHLIMTAHEKDKKNKEGNVIFTYPSITPASNNAIGQVIHVVGRLSAKTSKQTNGDIKYTREIQVHPTSMIEAKTRVGGLPLKVDPKTFIERTIDWLKNPGQDETPEPVVEEVSEEINLDEDTIQIDPDEMPDYHA